MKKKEKAGNTFRRNTSKNNMKKGFLHYLNPKNMKIEMHRCGYEFSFSKYLKFLLACYVGLVAFAFVFKLKIQFIIPIILIVAFLIPSIFLLQYRNMYEQKKFEEITSYMEQLLYSFKRHPKILTALQDTLTLFQNEEDERLRNAIEKAIEHIQNGVAETNIYEEAFAFIEEEYGCKRLYKIHNFLIRVEQSGGTCGEAIDILLMDRNLWMDRIYDLIREKQRVRVNVAIAIGLSFLIVGMSIYMVPSDFYITDHFASQLVTTIVILTDFLIWYVVQQMLSGSLLLADGDVPFETLKRSYDLIMHGDQKKLLRKFHIFGYVFIIATVVVYFATKNITVTALVGAFALIVFTQGNRKWKVCKKRVTREVEKAFPEWLLSVSLQMQTDNVHVSIAKSIDEAPEILREELVKLQEGIEKHPTDLDPYIAFFHDLYISDIATAMKMLYSMAEFGAEDAQEQIKSLVERNTKIMDKAEKLRMDDQLAGISFAMLLPMITGVVKMLTDLVLVFVFILQQVNV